MHIHIMVMLDINQILAKHCLYDSVYFINLIILKMFGIFLKYYNIFGYIITYKVLYYIRVHSHYRI